MENMDSVLELLKTKIRKQQKVSPGTLSHAMDSTKKLRF